MERARAVVVGGGITGASVAYHLAKAGWHDVVLLEKDELTSGSTCHAAGLVTQFNPSPTMMRFRRYSIELYQELGVFETVGSLRFASSKDQLMELRRGVSRARGIGLDVELVSADESAHLMPVITRDSLYGAVWVPGDGLYGKGGAGGMVLGGYESNPVARWIDGVPWDHAGLSLPPDQARFEPLLAGAARRFPFVNEAGIVKLVCHPDAMTPDAGPLVGPVPGVRGLYMATGLSLNGFGGAGGIGRAIAELVTTGETELDLHPYRPWRFGPVHHDHRYASELGRETYKYYYLLRYPYDSDEWGRPRRTSALHTRMQDLGAVFGVKHGWERPDYFQPGKPWRRAGADQRAFGFTRPPYFDHLAEEPRAFRERVGIRDMSSFGKVEITGPGSLPLLERLAGNLIDRTVGTVIYTQLLAKNGGIAADV